MIYLEEKCERCFAVEDKSLFMSVLVLTDTYISKGQISKINVSLPVSVDSLSWVS